MTPILRKFPNDPPRPEVVEAKGLYLQTRDGRTLMDATSGATTLAALGYSHPQVLAAMRAQMERFCHLDYNVWRDPNLEILADILLSRAPKGLGKVYFPGNSGSEAMEAAMKLSFQVQHDSGRKTRKYFISRLQSFHGATLHGIAMSELPILDFYQPILPETRAKIAQHHPLYHKRPDESLDDYARRSARELEDKILELGADNVCAFVAETMLGSLVGDVPPAPGYWTYVREVCDRHGVHLILDEIYCGLGRSGRIYCIDWDGITPDFVCVGKNLAAGHAPLSAVITRPEFEDVIAKGQGRIQHGHTHQGYSLGVAAAIAVQSIVHTDEMLAHIEATGRHIHDTLTAELGSHPWFRDSRGRGLLRSLEYDGPDKAAFGLALANRMNERHDIIINAKWHRASLTPPYIITRAETDRLLDCFVESFRALT
jgi:adenosylmethionine-8-amino-7-oxononanoate aminotransferase